MRCHSSEMNDGKFKAISPRITASHTTTSQLHWKSSPGTERNPMTLAMKFWAKIEKKEYFFGCQTKFSRLISNVSIPDQAIACDIYFDIKRKNFLARCYSGVIQNVFLTFLLSEFLGQESILGFASFSFKQQKNTFSGWFVGGSFEGKIELFLWQLIAFTERQNNRISRLQKIYLRKESAARVPWLNLVRLALIQMKTWNIVGYGMACLNKWNRNFL